MTIKKSPTDLHWNERALTESDPAAVNIADDVQRHIETDFLLRHLTAGSRVLEVGCGNGHLTEILRSHAGFVDAFDYAENMVESAKRLHGETNNRFFHDSVLSPVQFKGPYDAVVCVRVLINLQDLDEQRAAFKHIQGVLRPGGQLLLIEGFSDGFEALNQLRSNSGLEPLTPAPINFYSPLAQWLPFIEADFEIEARFHSGSFDFLTRVIYPALVGTEQATGPSEFHQRVLPVVRAFNPDAFAPLARLHGFALRKRVGGSVS